MDTSRSASANGRGTRRALSAGAATLLAIALVNGYVSASEAPTIQPGRDPGPITTALYSAGAPAPGSYTGLAFDACSAPSSEAMQAWLASPYRAVGIYFGGINRGCTQPNLTPQWVTAQQGRGWHLIPIYVGRQAPCTTSTKRYRIDSATASAQGRAEADDAVAQAMALGLPKESMLIFDMEAYRTGDPACRTAVLTFISAWNARLHDRGYLAGFYSSMSSGVADQVSVYNSASRVRPDYIDFARWDGVVTVSDSAIPSGYWSPHRRMKQYRGGHPETWGGVTINIDNDYVDFAPLPKTAFGDVNGNGWADVIARDTSTGRLYLYPGNGNFLGTRSTMATGWNALSELTRLGDFNRDGREDVIARESATGYLWLYPGATSGFGARIRIGTGWNTMREITAAGDLNSDGYADLLAVKRSTGYLYFYPGRGTGLGSRVSLGYGWNTMDQLTGVGDFNRDGHADLIARHKATGYLYLYPGRGVGFASRVRIGTGWNGMRGLAGVGDFDRDGYPDLVAIEKSTNYLYRYPGRGSGFAGRVRMGTGWGSMKPLL